MEAFAPTIVSYRAWWWLCHLEALVSWHLSFKSLTSPGVKPVSYHISSVAGASGMGSYHGRNSFDTFSNRKSCLIRSTRFECVTYLRYPPYEDRNLSLMTWASTLSQKSQGWCQILWLYGRMNRAMNQVFSHAWTVMMWKCVVGLSNLNRNKTNWSAAITED